MSGLLQKGREQVYAWLRSCLIGPENPGETGALLQIKPLDRYQTGILFPVLADEHGLDAVIDDAEDAEGTDNDHSPSLGAAQGTSQAKRRFVPPSSVGFSFYIEASEGHEIQLQVIPRAVRYEPADELTKVGREDQWQPVTLGRNDSEALDFGPPPLPHRHQERPPVFDGRAEVMVLWRPLGAGWLVTVSLSNTQEDPGRGDEARRATERNRLALFQVELECLIEAGRVGDYPRVDPSLMDEEERELELQYRAHRIFAIGHGAAVDWEVRGDRVRRLRTDFLPRVEVPQVSAECGPADALVLSIDWLAGIDQDPAPRFDELNRFADRYQVWIKRKGEKAIDPDTSLTAAEQATASRILARMGEALRRIREGTRLLQTDPVARRAFALANRAMAWQMRQAARTAGAAPRAPAWRPFQLAFLLLALPSALDPDHPDRDTVDLIWFPTGGGKTEAYLGLLACVICWRRLKYPTSGGGTAALMRYTLRLLTKDQFRRAARLICALELLRRDEPALGGEPISLGLWVGGDSSPNHYAEARQVIDQALDRADTGSEVALPSALVLEQCPWCGVPLRLPSNVDAGPRHFRFRCIAGDCAFGAGSGGELPCNVVDTALYERPPTLLLATLDKFARLAWEERAGAFLGGPQRRPPELIIQDELHLIAGALGTVAGLYEAALETVLAGRDLYPKIIASTATIRQARDQVRRLFGREPAIFPPPGLGCEDSYFARTVPVSERPGRLYVGYLAPARDRPHCLAPVAAALLAAPELLFGATPAADREALLDAWWTVLVYHGSLKGVGISRNAVQDIETLMARLHQEGLDRRLAEPDADTALYGGTDFGPDIESDARPGDGAVSLPDPPPDTALGTNGGTNSTINQGQDSPTTPDEARRLGPKSGPDSASFQAPTLERHLHLAERITQLTSQMSADDNARSFERLRRPRTDPDALDLALATNMISVGLDVARLAVMVINGQPLTTAEYIQASSRVGRGEVPGIVVANYYRDQARSLSHYESFRAYHESFYRFVEPTSLTPFTWQARQRALHAALVIVIRHGCPDLAANEQAGSLDPDRPEVARLIQELARRCQRADPGRGEETARHLTELARQWADLAAMARAQRQRLVYAGSDGDRRDLRLLYGHEDRVHGLWPTLHSMRNVENTALVKVL